MSWLGKKRKTVNKCWMITFKYLKTNYVFRSCSVLSLDQLCRSGNMMSRGQRGQEVSGRRLQLMDLSIKRELILPALSELDGSGAEREFLSVADRQQHRANSLAREITFCNGPELPKWKRTFN